MSKRKLEEAEIKALAKLYIDELGVKKLSPSSLEALNYVVSNERFAEPTCKEEQEKRETCIQILETTLKRLEDLEKWFFEDKDYKNHKALEIIKKLPKEEKQVLLNAVYTYTKSEEKYDLLKEVLL